MVRKAEGRREGRKDVCTIKLLVVGLFVKQRGLDGGKVGSWVGCF